MITRQKQTSKRHQLSRKKLRHIAQDHGVDRGRNTRDTIANLKKAGVEISKRPEVSTSDVSFSDFLEEGRDFNDDPQWQPDEDDFFCWASNEPFWREVEDLAKWCNDLLRCDFHFMVEEILPVIKGIINGNGSNRLPRKCAETIARYWCKECELGDIFRVIFRTTGWSTNAVYLTRGEGNIYNLGVIKHDCGTVNPDLKRQLYFRGKKSPNNKEILALYNSEFERLGVSRKRVWQLDGHRTQAQ